MRCQLSNPRVSGSSSGVGKGTSRPGCAAINHQDAALVPQAKWRRWQCWTLWCEGVAWADVYAGLTSEGEGTSWKGEGR